MTEPVHDLEFGAVRDPNHQGTAGQGAEVDPPHNWAFEIHRSPHGQ